MHIKDHNDAMTFFRNSKQLESNGKWKDFVDEMEFESMAQEPRATAQEPRIGLKPGGIVEPGVMHYAKKHPRPERRIYKDRILTQLEKTKRYMEAHPEKKYKTTKTDFIFEGKKISIDVPGMKPESKGKMKDLLKGVEKWKQDPTTENWLKIFRKARKSAPGSEGPIQYRHGWSKDLRKYLQGEKTGNALTKNIFDQLDIKKSLNLSKDEVKMIKSYVDLQSPAIATRVASEKALRKSFENVIEINKHFKTNPNISLNELTKKIYKSKFIDADAAGKLKMSTSVSDDVAKYLEALKDARDIPKGLKSQWSPPTGKNHKLITDRIFSQTDFRFQEGTLRKYKYSIRDSMLKLRPNTTYNLEKKLKLTKGVLDHAVGLSATFDIAPGYTEAMQVLENAVNKAKGHGIDKPFGEALRAALEKGDFSKIDAYNELAATWQKKNPGVDVPFIRKGGDPKKLILHFDDFSPEAKKNILKIAGGEKGVAIETKGMPMKKLISKFKPKPVVLGSFPANITADMLDFRKLPDDAKHFANIIRESLKKKNITLKSGDAGSIAKKLLNDFGKMGLKGTKLLRWLQLEYDVLFESLIYQYHRQYKGQEPELAREALWLPKIIAKYAPDLWERAGFKPFKAGVWEGPEAVLEKELIGSRWDPGKKGENLVGAYIDNQKRMEEISSKWDNLDFQKKGSSRVHLTPEQVESFENQQAALAEEYQKLEQLNKPDSLSGYHSAYTTALEAQETEEGIKATEAHKKRLGVKDYPWDIENPNEMLKYDKNKEKRLERAQKRFEKEQDAKRQKAMDDKFPGYGKYETDKMLEALNLYIDPKLSYKGQTVQRPKGLKKLKNIPYYFSDKKSVPATYESLSDYRKNLKKMEYYADNFRMEKAGGGIMSLKKKR